MKTIYKYQLAITDRQGIEMPVDAEILSVQFQRRGTLCAWALVDTSNQPTIRTICIYGTGHPVSPSAQRFLATVQDGSLVWHVFEDLTGKALENSHE